jgi:hypothetical protein
MKALADAKLSRENFDLLTGAAADIVGQVSLPKSAERAALAAAWDAVLQQFAADTRLSATDRLSAVGARIDLARLDAPEGALPEPLLAAVREHAARGARETTDPYARETVITAPTCWPRRPVADPMRSSRARALGDTVYLMLGLASNAKKTGDKAAPSPGPRRLVTASGPATRLQWGAGYVNALIDLAPDDAVRIERAAVQVIGELEPAPDTFYDRNRRSLERMTRKLAAWNKDKPHQEALQRIRAELAGVCARLPAGDPGRAACSGVWNPPKSAA